MKDWTIAARFPMVISSCPGGSSRGGLDRVTSPGAAMTLDAQASMFAESYLRELLSSSAGSIVNIANPNAIGTDFSADKDSDYVIRLTATSDSADATEANTLLKRLSGPHHYGRQVVGFDTSPPVGAAGRANYDLFVNWIAEGAKCGIAGATKCP